MTARQSEDHEPASIAAEQLQEDVFDVEDEANDPRGLQPSAGGTWSSRRDQAAQVVARAAARHHAECGRTTTAPTISSRENRVPCARHREARHRGERDEGGNQDTDDRKSQTLECNGRRRDLRRDPIVEEHDLQRLAGDAAHGEEGDGVRGEADAKQRA